MTSQIARRPLALFSAQFATAALLIVYPIVNTTVKGASNICFAALVALALFEFLRMRKLPWRDDDRTALIFAIGMCSLFVAIAVSQLGNQNFAARPFDGALRFIFAVPIFLYLRLLPVERLTVIQYGFAIGTLVALVVMSPEQYGSRAGTYFLNPIHFGDMSLAAGLLSALSIHWGRSDRWHTVALKLTGFAVGVAMSIWSGSRGGWIAIPVAALVWLVLADYAWSWRTRLGAFIGVVVLLYAIYVFVAPVHDRINLLISELTGLTSQTDTSTGLRFQIMRAAAVIFIENPIFGTGSDRFGNVIPDLFARGYLTRSAADLMGGEIHNDVLKWTASAGVFGLLSSLAVFIVPFALFARASRSAVAVQRKAGTMGAVFVSTFFVFSQTVEIFILKGTTAFYCLTIAALLAVATNLSSSAEAKAA